MGDWCGPPVRHRMKRKQGRVTERSRTGREEKKGKEENSFHRKCLCFLTCLLMGDPMPPMPHASLRASVPARLFNFTAGLSLFFPYTPVSSQALDLGPRNSRRLLAGQLYLAREQVGRP